MKRAFLFALVAGVVAGSVLAADVLTVEDIEKVAGVAGVKSAPRDPRKAAGGDLNFTGPDGKLLVMVKLYASGFEKLKKMYFAADVPGVGDEAFAAPKGVPQPYVLFLRKGGRAASVTTYFDRSARPKLSLKQLAELGRIVASRM